MNWPISRASSPVKMKAGYGWSPRHDHGRRQCKHGREQLSQMASRQITFYRSPEKPMMRIENKTYGICRVTGKLIDKGGWGRTACHPEHRGQNKWWINNGCPTPVQGADALYGASLNKPFRHLPRRAVFIYSNTLFLFLRKPGIPLPAKIGYSWICGSYLSGLKDCCHYCLT